MRSLTSVWSAWVTILADHTEVEVVDLFQYVVSVQQIKLGKTKGFYISINCYTAW